MGCKPDDVDGINETFTLDTHSEFYVGAYNIEANTCNATQLYNSTGHRVFEEVLLYVNQSDGDGDGVIFTSIIQQDTVGYDGGEWDFEMIVGENGHNGSTGSTTYYFYVELELSLIHI